MRVKDFHVARTFSPLPYLGGKNAGNLVLEPWCPSVTVPCPVRASFARDKEFLSGGKKKKLMDSERWLVPATALRLLRLSLGATDKTLRCVRR